MRATRWAAGQPVCLSYMQVAAWIISQHNGRVVSIVRFVECRQVFAILLLRAVRATRGSIWIS